MPKRTNILATIRLDRKTRGNPDAPASEADLPDRSEPVLKAAGQKSSAGETSGKVQPVEHSASVADMAASEAEAKVAVKGRATESAADPKAAAAGISEQRDRCATAKACPAKARQASVRSRRCEGGVPARRSVFPS